MTGSPHRLLFAMLGALLIVAAPLSAEVNPRLEYAFGVLEESRGIDGAMLRFENARRADPMATPLLERAVERLLGAGERAQAIRLYRKFAAARPDAPALQLSYAAFLARQGRGDALAAKLATQALELTLSEHPGHPEIIRRLSSSGHPQARSFLLQLAPDDPESVLLFASLSRGEHDSGDTAIRTETDRRFLLALEACPEHPLLARRASNHFRDTGRLDQAIRVLKKHTTAAPWSLDLRVRLGVLELSAKQNNAGLATLTELLAIHPRKPLAHQALVEFHQRRNRPELASFHAAELLKIRSGPVSEFIRLADERLASGDARGARRLLEKAVVDYPENIDLRMKLAMATHRDPGTRDRASRLFRVVETAFPEGKTPDAAFFLTAAEVLIESGQSRAAEERLKAAIRSYPRDAKQETAAALRRMAELWDSENRNADAAKSLRKRANSLDPR